MSSFERIKPFDFFSQVGRPAPSDLMGPRVPQFVTQSEREEAQAAVRNLWERIRAAPSRVVFDTRPYIHRDWGEADVLVTLDSLGMVEDKPKRLLSLSRNPRRREDRPVFKLSFDPQAQIKDVP